jgi:thiol-disulfide isomerase/thioredoxin
MNILKPGTVAILCFWVMFLSLGAAAPRVQTATASRLPGAQAQSKTIDFQTIELALPQVEQDQTYLGLSGKGRFRIGQIKARVLLIEVFSFYCIHCQRMAPRMNEVFQEIQKSPALRENVRMIGIGVGNSPFEVKSFKEKYQVPFPLFSDQSMKACQALGVEATPTFIGVKGDEKGPREQFYFEEGEFPDVSQFLAKIVKLAGLSQEGQK